MSDKERFGKMVAHVVGRGWAAKFKKGDINGVQAFIIAKALPDNFLGFRWRAEFFAAGQWSPPMDSNTSSPTEDEALALFEGFADRLCFEDCTLEELGFAPLPGQ